MQDTTTQIAVALAFLRDTLGRGRNGKRLAVKDLVVVLNGEAKTHEPFKVGKVYAVLKGDGDLSPAQQQEWVRIIEQLCQKEALEISKLNQIPEEIIARYAQHIPQPANTETTFSGDHIQDLDVLCGAWRFFYVSAVGRNSETKPEIRGVVAIFSRIEGTANKVAVQLISRTTHWIGVAFVFEWHLYIVCRAKEKTETAFFVVNEPSRRQTKKFVAGLGSALERGSHDEHHRHPAMGVLCFGEKCYERAGAKNIALDESITAVLDKLLNGTEILPSDEKTLRDEFKVTYNTMSDFKNTHPDLWAYLQKHVRVNKKPFSMASLLLEWV